MKVEIEGTKLIESYFTRNGYSWSALTLIEAAKDCEEFDFPLAAADLSYNAWNITNLYDFIYHCKRIEETDEKYPIILDHLGNVADGVHRICKAILAGKETIRAKRILKMPTADSYDKPEE